MATKNVLSQKFTTSYTNSLVHTDLSLINILRDKTGLFAIDWNEALWGPKAIDWMTILGSAYDRPDLQEMILEAMFKECEDSNERDETIRVAKVTAHWMLFKIAGSYDYFLKHSTENKKDADEVIRAFPLVKNNFSRLIQLLT